MIKQALTGGSLSWKWQWNGKEVDEIKKYLEGTYERIWELGEKKSGKDGDRMKARF